MMGILFPRKVPVVTQSEVAECGLACLNMLAIYHGHRVSMRYMRDHFPCRSTGTKLNELIHTASQLGFSTRAIKSEINELNNIKLPCIIHWDMNHYVVLCKIQHNGIIINDPASGRRLIPNPEFLTSYTGIVLEVTPRVDIELIKEKKKYRLSAFFSFTKEIKYTFLHILIMSIALEIISITSPIITQTIIDSVFTTSDKSLLSTILAGTLIILSINILISSARSIIIINLSSFIKLSWLNSLFHHLTKLPTKYFDSRTYGDISSRFNSLHAIQKTITDFILTSFLDGTVSFITLMLMFLYSPSMTSISLIGIFTYTIARYFWYSYLYTENENLLKLSAEEENYFIETLKGIQTIKTNNYLLPREASWMNIITRQNNSSVKLQKMSVLYSATNNIIIGLEGSAILWIGANQVINNEFSIGMYLAFIAYNIQFSSRVSSLVDSVMSLKLLNLHWLRISDILEQEQEQEHGHRESQAILCGKSNILKDHEKLSIEFINVYFRYNDNDEWIIRNLSFKVSPSEKVVITGPNGCGKSTILKLINKLYKPQKGKILINDVDIQNLPTSELRSIISSTFQSDYIFSGSIVENICLTDRIYDEKKLIDISRSLHILDFINALPLGFHTPINSMSVSLSAGQQQKILLARALYRTPKILLLDEATSNLDITSEKAINNYISETNVTTLMVAHRDVTINSADRIITLK